MKKIKYILSLLAIVFTISCDTDGDNLVSTSDQGGVIINVDQSSGSLLGTPASGVDLDDAEVTFITVDLDFDARINLGTGVGISKYEIVKTFNGGAEVSITETPSLPFNVVYTDVSEYVAGFGVAASDLRIGDVFTFKVKIHKTDGSIYYYAPSMGHFSVVVNCLSSLTGTYTNPNIPDCGGSGGDVATVTEVSPGRYWVSSMPVYSWASGNCIGFYMIDVCGVLIYDNGDLEENGYDGNAQTPGQVNADGSFSFTFQLPAAGYGPDTVIYTPL